MDVCVHIYFKINVYIYIFIYFGSCPNTKWIMKVNMYLIKNSDNYLPTVTRLLVEAMPVYIYIQCMCLYVIIA